MMKMMPNCRDITEQASDYQDQNLPLLKRLGFRLHLLMCTYCRQHVKHLDITISALGKIDSENTVTKTSDTQQIRELIKQQQDKGSSGQ